MEIEDFLEIAFEQFDKYGLTQAGWVVETNPRLIRTLGVCVYADRIIVMSERHLQQSSKAEILDTLGHECIHAILGPGYGHGPEWQKLCIQNGINPMPYANCFIRKRDYLT